MTPFIVTITASAFPGVALRLNVAFVLSPVRTSFVTAGTFEILSKCTFASPDVAKSVLKTSTRVSALASV